MRLIWTAFGLAGVSQHKALQSDANLNQIANRAQSSQQSKPENMLPAQGVMWYWNDVCPVIVGPIIVGSSAGLVNELTEYESRAICIPPSTQRLICVEVPSWLGKASCSER